jgi:hypothetical protein
VKAGRLRCALDARSCDEACVQSWSGSMLGKNLTEYCKVAAMSQGQFSKRIFGEPRDGIVFAWRDVDRRPRPRFDQPDLHVERVATNFLHGRTRRRRDVDAQLLSKFSSKCRARHFPRLHVPTGQVPDVGIPTAPGRSVTEQNPVAVPQQRRDDTSLRGAFRRDRHRRIVPPVVSDTVPCRVPAACPIARRAAATTGNSQAYVTALDLQFGMSGARRTIFASRGSCTLRAPVSGE